MSTSDLGRLILLRDPGVIDLPLELTDIIGSYLQPIFNVNKGINLVAVNKDTQTENYDHHALATARYTISRLAPCFERQESYYFIHPISVDPRQYRIMTANDCEIYHDPTMKPHHKIIIGTEESGLSPIEDFSSLTITDENKTLLATVPTTGMITGTYNLSVPTD